jgi:hypothetical protein
MVELENARPLVGFVTVNGTMAELPPLELETVTKAVVGTAIFEAGTVADSLLELMYVVASAVPFQLTTELGTNPVPFTVKLNCGEPGATVSGTSGTFTNGTG